jgi:nucleotide-binding universal stress UspA family protein
MLELIKMASHLLLAGVAPDARRRKKATHEGVQGRWQMYDRILIHIDRRNAFETYVPYLEGVLRRKIAKEAVLTTVVKPCEPTLFGYVLDPEDVASTDATNLADAREFLQSLATRLQEEGIPLKTDALLGDPVEAFRTYVAQRTFDLVVIAPTGRRYLLTGKPRAFRRALRQVSKPIMVLQALPAQTA